MKKYILNYFKAIHQNIYYAKDLQVFISFHTSVNKFGIAILYNVLSTYFCWRK